MSLFVELYLDEDVDVLIADLLKAYGFSALTTRDADQIQNSDADQLAYAAMRQKNSIFIRTVERRENYSYFLWSSPAKAARLDPNLPAHLNYL